MKHLFTILLVTSFTCFQSLNASFGAAQAAGAGAGQGNQPISEQAKMDRGNWVLTHGEDEILPFPARRVFQNATHRVVSSLRQQKIKSLRKELFKARTLACKMQDALKDVAHGAQATIETLQANYAKSQQDLKFNKRKHAGYKATMHQQYVELQNQGEQLRSQLQTVLDRDASKKELIDQLQGQLEAARAAHATATVQYQNTLQALNTAQAENQALQKQLRLEQAAVESYQRTVIHQDDEEERRREQYAELESECEQLKLQLGAAYKREASTQKEMDAMQRELGKAEITIKALKSRDREITEALEDAIMCKLRLKAKLDKTQADRAASEQTLSAQLAAAQQVHTKG